MPDDTLDTDRISDGAMRGIARVDPQGSPGWAVTLYRDNGARGRRLHMALPDATFGGQTRPSPSRKPGATRPSPSCLPSSERGCRAWPAAPGPPPACPSRRHPTRGRPTGSRASSRLAPRTRRSARSASPTSARACAEAECRRMEEALVPDATWVAPPLSTPPQDPASPRAGGSLCRLPRRSLLRHPPRRSAPGRALAGGAQSRGPARADQPLGRDLRRRGASFLRRLCRARRGRPGRAAAHPRAMAATPAPTAHAEPRRVSRRPFGLGQAAKACTSV